MHFAMPPRRTSNPLYYSSRSLRLLGLRLNRIKVAVFFIIGIGMVLIFISRMLADKGRISLGSPPVVVVTPLKPDGHSKEYIEDIKENRIEYARKHGYATFFPVTTEYELDGAPLPWAKIPAMRHALTKFPQGTYFWFLEQDSLIMNPTFTIESHIMDPQRMEELMIKDQPVVLPESVIKTFSHLRGGQIDFVLTQDKDGLAPSSFVLRRGEWAKFFLDTWFDPLYRGYNFQRAETHALEHIVQWHPTILSKLALVPQRVMNAYDVGSETSAYKPGDFVIRFSNCEAVGSNQCESAAALYSQQWRTIFKTR